MRRFIAVFVLFLFLFHETFAYVGNTGTLGDVSITLEKPPRIDALEQPVTVATILHNKSDADVSIRLDYRTIETLEFPDSDGKDKRLLTKTVVVPAEETVEIEVEVRILAHAGTYNAHYPISLDATATVDGKETTVHMVHPIETKVGPNPNWNPTVRYPETILKPWPKPTQKNETEFALPLTLSYHFSGKRRCFIEHGKKGLLDGTIALIDGERSIAIQGLRIWIAGHPLTEFVTASPQFVGSPNSSGNVWNYDVEVDGKKTTVSFTIKAEQDALRLSVDSPEPGLITAVEFGPMGKTANRVYFGHGYVVEQPGQFRVRKGGHHLSTSHVGFDFENGLSLLMGTTTPPEYLEIVPETKTYTLNVKPGTTFILMWGNRDDGGALGCAMRYRAYTDKHPAPGVDSKAGRFVVDIWNGRYTEHAELIRQAAKYGLRNDVLFLSHNWQRFQYDHRLPDVWPPNPKFGTTDEMKSAMKAAHDNGWLFGVHLNCIDYYPDSSVFTFDDVAFLQNGDPRKAYLNVMLDAQSYYCRPDHAADVLEKSTQKMLAEFPLSAAFVDVLAANTPTDYYDRHGKFYSSLDGLQGWKNVFERLGNRMNAPTTANEKLVGKRPETTGNKKIVYPTISEAGHDFLAGTLDGADCQFMYLSNIRDENRWLIVPKYADWERIPWFDAVNHRNFSLHGAGYSIRYEGGRGRELHGIDSDDYIGTEIMLGHPPMVDGSCRDVKEVLEGTVRSMDVPAALRATVRKYWLSQPVARCLAFADIKKMEFVGGDIHRQRIEWTGGTVVYVNRGQADWTVDGVVLPRYGYWVKNESLQLDSSICRIGGKVVERTTSPREKYFNARGTVPNGLIPATPSVDGFERFSEKEIRLPIRWNVQADLPVKDYRLTLHLAKQKNTEAAAGEDAVIGYAVPELPTSRWKKGEYRTKTRRTPEPWNEETLTIPDEFPTGTYDLLVSADDPAHPNDVHRRGPMLATPSFWYRYRLGKLTLKREKETGKINDLTFEPAPNDDAPLYERLIPSREAVDFGPCKTSGAFHIVSDFERKKIALMPLPGEPSAMVELPADVFLPNAGTNIRGEVLDEDGKPTGPLTLTVESGKISFSTREGNFAYVISTVP